MKNVVGLLAVAASTGLASCSSERGDFDRAKLAVTNTLSDPVSAQFRNLVSDNKAGWKTVCGEVNAKNKFGGYVGYKRFGYSMSDGEIWFQDQAAQNSVAALPSGSDQGAIQMAKVADESAALVRQLWQRRCNEGAG